MNILDPRFVYVPAVSTNVAETFKRVRERMAHPALGPIFTACPTVQPSIWRKRNKS